MRLPGPAILALIAAIVGLASCAAPPPAPEKPLASPRVATRVRHFAGRALQGPEEGPTSVTAGAATMAWQATATFVALDRLPETLLAPLSARARMLVADDPRPIRPAPRLLGGARAGEVADPTTFAARVLAGGPWRAAPIETFRAALPSGVTAAFEAWRETGRDLTGAPRQERLTLFVSRVAAPTTTTAEQYEITVQVATAPTEAQESTEESAVLERAPLHAPSGYAVIVPAPLANEETRAIAIIVELAPAPPIGGVGEAAHLEAFAACRADLARDDALRGSRDEPGRPRAVPPPDLTLARAGLRDPAHWRSSLVAISAAVRTPLLDDVALSAPDAMLAPIVTAVADVLASVPTASAGPALAWPLEHACLREMATLATDPDHRDAAALYLQRRTGAAGRLVGTFLGSVDAASGLDDMEARLVAANRAFLEDGDPALRSLASGWLADRGLAPPGYDPLAPAPARREALEAAGLSSDDGSE